MTDTDDQELAADRIRGRRQLGWIAIVLGVIVAGALVTIGLERQTDPLFQSEDAQGPCGGAGIGTTHERPCEPADESGNHALILVGLVAGIAIAGTGASLLAKHPAPRG
ncbi:MAG: hypothetical protein ACM31C_10960 [Acidobacteriota bacterium]